MSRGVDEEEFLVLLVRRVVLRTILVGARSSSNWKRALYGKGCLGGVSECSLATLELRYC